MENYSSVTKYCILAELSKGEKHGYQLINRIKEMTGKKPSAGQIYPLLKQMRSLGYLNVRAKKEGKKKLKFYKMTPAGKKFFAAISKRFEALMMAALKQKIKVCAHCGCEMISGGVSKNTGGKKLHFCCSSCASSFKLLEKI